MKSYTQGRNLAGVWTKNSAAANLTYLDQTANDEYRHLCAKKDWPFLERSRTLTTKASTQFLPLPYDVDQVKTVSVLVGTTTYVVKQSPSKDHWDQLNLSVFTSDVPEWYFVYAGQIGLWPKPASAGNTIQINAKIRVIDLQFADYTTGTITTTSTTLGVTTVTGSGTTFTAQMVGRYIQIAGVGDLEWYEISGFTSSTVITLTRAYGGTALSGASAAFTIGQMPLLPESFQDTPWKKSAQVYWEKEADARSAAFKTSYDQDVLDLIRTWSSPGTDMVIDSGDESQIINPNLVISL